MMKTRHFLSIVAAFTLIGSILFIGCDFNEASDTFDEFDIIVALEEVNSFVAIMIIDAQTQNFISQDVKMIFRGEDAGAVIDMFSDVVADLTVSGGIGSFGIQNSLVPSVSSPANIRIVFTAAGYNPGSVTISMINTGQTTSRVFLTRESQVVQGAVSTTDTGGVAGAGGVVSTAVTAQTADNSQNQVSASVTVPVGTTAQTSTGQPASGTLTTNINLYTAITAATAQALPGGYSATVQTSSGVVQQTAITTAGFMSVSVTDGGGNQITQFNPPIELSMGVAGDTHNRRTGATVQAGDVFGVYSYNDSDGVWVEEGESTLTGPDADGNFKASFLTDHLSDWLVGEADPDATCDSGVFTVNRNGNTGPINVAVGSYMPRWFPGVFTIPPGENTLTIKNAPNGLGQYFLSFSHAGVPHQNINDAGAANGSICGQGGAVTFDAPPPTLIDVMFTMDLEGDGDPDTTDGTCRALIVTDVPMLTVFVKESGQPDASSRWVGADPVFVLDDLGRIVGGTLVANGLIVGTTYTFYTSVNNERQERDVTVTGPAMILDISDDVTDNEICSE